MKFSAPVLLSYCLLLMVTGSCKKDLVEEPAPNLANCRIVKETYQVGWRPQATPTKETVQADGKLYDVMLARQSTFSYDSQGRIIKEDRNIVPYVTPGIPYIVTYAYNSTALYIRRVSAKWAEEDTIYLNPQGLSSKGGDGFIYYYDEQGYFTHATLTTGEMQFLPTRDSNKNEIVLKTLAPYTGEKRTQTFTYDLSKANLPNKYPFYGKSSPNLQTRHLFEVDQSVTFPVGGLFRIDSYYQFDKYGRVSREIDIETHLVPDQQYGQYIHPGGIGVIDFEYECPFI